MNRTKIEWCDYSWNPITGCLHNCWYCYAKKLFTRFHRSFKPQFHPKRLKEKFPKKPSKIFCCSVSDIFADWTPCDWTTKVIDKIKEHPEHTFQLLTKNPENIDKQIEFPENIWIGVTITTQNEVYKIDYLRKVKCKIRFVSFEPLLDNITKLNLENIDWIIIGKLTGSKKIPLQKQWVKNLILEARENKIPIFIKDNVKWHKKIQEFPE
jgi:protein gp37